MQCCVENDKYTNTSGHMTMSTQWPPSRLSLSSHSSARFLLGILQSISQLEWDDLHASCNLPPGDGRGWVCTYASVNVCLWGIDETCKDEITKSAMSGWDRMQKRKGKWAWCQRWCGRDALQVEEEVFVCCVFFIYLSYPLYFVQSHKLIAPNSITHKLVHILALLGNPNLQLLIW